MTIETKKRETGNGHKYINTTTECPYCGEEIGDEGLAVHIESSCEEFNG